MAKISAYSWMVVAVGLTMLGCKSGGVGDPCVPEDEYDPGFSGFSLKEVNVESRSFQCETRVCLVNHFQGRVSCPYGQDSGSGGCIIPGSQDEPIKVPVKAQLVARREDKAVYCSCRCAGPDPNARYCDCPTGFACVPLIDDLGLPGGQLAGSYCVREGTKYSPSSISSDTCLSSSENCPPKWQ